MKKIPSITSRAPNDVDDTAYQEQRATQHLAHRQDHAGGIVGDSDGVHVEVHVHESVGRDQSRGGDEEAPHRCVCVCVCVCVCGQRGVYRVVCACVCVCRGGGARGGIVMRVF